MLKYVKNGCCGMFVHGVKKYWYDCCNKKFYGQWQDKRSRGDFWVERTLGKGKAESLERNTEKKQEVHDGRMVMPNGTT